MGLNEDFSNVKKYARLCHSSKIKQIKFLIRAIVSLKEIQTLESFFQSNELLWLLEKHPKYMDKFFRPYLHCGLSVKERVETIVEHFRTSLQLFNRDFLLRLFSDKGLDLAQIEGYNDGKCYTVKLFHIGPLAREGEFTLGFFESDLRLYSATFVLRMANDTVQIFVGGFQGPNESMESRERMSHITKQFHGMRPFDFMIFLLQVFARFLNAQLLGVKDKHIIRHCSARKKEAVFLANYDTYWENFILGDKKEFYLLTTERQDKPMEAISSNKRSMYKKRYSMLDGVELQMFEGLKLFSHKT